MTQVAIIDGTNHGWNLCRVAFERGMHSDSDLSLTLGYPRDLLKPAAIREFEVVVLGSGFMHLVGEPGAPGARWEPELTPEQSQVLLQFVASGGGFVGLHITGWFLGGELVKLLGGSANLHPPIEDTQIIPVHFEQPAHDLVRGLQEFWIENDEVYLVSWSPEAHVIATTPWAGRRVPVMWLNSYGRGRVFYCSLGHFAHTYEHPVMAQILSRAVKWCGGYLRAANGIPDEL